MMGQVDGWDLLDEEDIQNPDFDLGGKQWRIKKLLPIEAKKVLYRYVFPLFNSAKEMDVEGLPPPAIMLRVVSSADPEILEKLSEVFMRFCIYFKTDAGQYVKLVTDVENATKDMLPVELMILDVRAFAVNFGESVSKAVEEFRRRQETDNPMDQSAPTPSSTPVSTPDTTPSQTSNRGRRKATRK